MFRFTLLTLALLTGCPTKDETACDAMAAGSIDLTVVDPSGEAIPGAVATWSVDGGDEQPCDAMSSTTWVCGWEVAGDITVRVTADGYTDFEQVVTVEQGECHVVPETLTATLDGVDCTMEVRPSVLATVVSVDGIALSGTQVSYTDLATSTTAACAPTGSPDEWSCGEELAGDLRITAVADGHVEQSVDVTVGADACHVLTEDVRIELEWGAD